MGDLIVFLQDSLAVRWSMIFHACSITVCMQYVPLVSFTTINIVSENSFMTIWASSHMCCLYHMGIYLVSLAQLLSLVGPSGTR